MSTRARPAGRGRRGAWVALLAAVLGTGVGLGASALPGHVPPVAADGTPRELVVLVHGMGRSPLSMAVLGRRLEADGYRVVNWGYSSYDEGIPALAAALAADVRAEAGPAPKVHFVGHSMGNVLIRWALSNAPPEHVGRVVMLAPPNQGSAAADRYAPYLAWLMPPIEELRTDPTSSARTIPVPAALDFGVIAGSDDGKVSVAETLLPGQDDHLVLKAGHSFLMNREDVHQQVLTYLRTGHFTHDGH